MVFSTHANFQPIGVNGVVRRCGNVLEERPNELANGTLRW